MTSIFLAGFIFSLLIPLIYRYTKRLTGWIVTVYALSVMLYFVSFIRQISSGEVFYFYHNWVPSLNISFSFMLDGLSLLFSILITAIGALVFAYANSYLPENDKKPRFYLYILIFMSSMIGLVLSENLLTMFIFWELTSISSYMLIGFYHERDASRKSALQALLITAGGGLALLAGILIIGQVSGTYSINQLLVQSDLIRSSPLYMTILILVLIGAFTKSAQFPFHFWLPGAMEAPAPVSAYLHSATMVTAGVYLLARLNPFLGGTDEWHYIITITGAVTMIIGAIISLYQSDLKRMLAYSTVSALGTMMLLLGIDTALSIKAAMVFLLVHSLYKGSLFLVAGTIDHETGIRDVNSIGGLFKAMPLTAIAACLAALSMAGLPPLFGFIAKELVYEAKLQVPDIGTLIAIIGILSNILLIAVAGILSIQMFFGSKKQTPKDPHEAPISMVLGPIVLSVLGLIVGLFPDSLAKPLISAAVSAVRAEQTTIKLALWHGINQILMLGLLTLVGGVIAYLAREKIKKTLQYIPINLRADHLYDLSLLGLNKLARAQTKVIQSGYLSYYVMIVILTVIGLVGGSFFYKSGSTFNFTNLEITVYEIMVIVAIVLGVGISIFSSSRLMAIVGLCVVGFGITIIFILFGAPDLAITQFAIETLTVILFVLAIYKLPKFLPLSVDSVKYKDAIVALFFGGTITVLLLNVISVPMASDLKTYFGDNSLSLGKGLNVVNVILVDFRALDTLGEVIVLSVAATGIYSLLKLRMEK